MSKIHILDEHIANQIAAGEVVERPASVVKELVENSIDAGSTNVEILLQEGGISSIQIKDNGEGMGIEDVERAFFRHATSKIRTGKDLFKINTLGFRGEALPSIAAVSQLTLKTATNDTGEGVELILEAGKINKKQLINYSKGTNITVKNIFFNTPARLKYMKSLQTELGHITDYIHRLSLAYPAISFTLIHNERLILRTNGDSNLQHVIASIYGSSIAKNMLLLTNESLDFSINGYLSKPEITRANKNHMSVFINGRYIKNYLLSKAIVKGYDTLLMINRYPITVLDIKMDPSLVDVNVHPSKLEVRFSKEQELLKFIEESIHKTLEKHTFIREPMKTANHTSIHYQKSVQPSLDFVIQVKEENVESEPMLIQPEEVSIKNILNEVMQQSNSFPTKSDSNHKYTSTSKNVVNSQQLPLLDPIAQLFGTYIIAQSNEGLFLIDQHAAHERINFEKNVTLMNQETVTSQELIVPITIDYLKNEIDNIVENIHLLENIGINIELFGQQTIIVRSIPQWIPKGEEQEKIEQIIHMLLTKKQIDLGEIRQDMVASKSCKLSIKANHYLTKLEMEQLIEQLRHTKNPYSCPHGRPVIIHFSVYEIEKMFKRVV